MKDFVPFDQYVQSLMQDDQKKMFLKLAGIITDVAHWTCYDPTPGELTHFIELEEEGYKRDHYYMTCNRELYMILIQQGEIPAWEWLEEQLKQVELE